MVIFTEELTKEIIRKLFMGEDYSSRITSLINENYLRFVLTVFQKTVESKLNNEIVDDELFDQSFFLEPLLSADDVTMNTGLDLKNENYSGKGSSVNVIKDYHRTLSESLREWDETEDSVALTLNTKLRGVSVDLNVSESRTF